MKDVLGMSHDEMAETFDEWNKGELDSFLIEISANILKYGEVSLCSSYSYRCTCRSKINVKKLY